MGSNPIDATGEKQMMKYWIAVDDYIGRRYIYAKDWRQQAILFEKRVTGFDSFELAYEALCACKARWNAKSRKWVWKVIWGPQQQMTYE